MQNLFSSLVLLCILLISCNFKNKQENQNSIANENTEMKSSLNDKKTAVKDVYLDDFIMAKIINHYADDYGKNTRLVVTETDTTKKMAYYNIPEEKDGYSFAQMTVTIPKKMSSESVFLGDLNNDKNEDLIVSVSTQGGGGGGNVWWDDIFIFLKGANGYQLKITKTNWEMVECNGYMAISEIKNNKIMGESFCYDKKDARCCPSLNYDIVLKLNGDKIIMDKQTKK